MGGNTGQAGFHEASPPWDPPSASLLPAFQVVDSIFLLTANQANRGWAGPEEQDKGPWAQCPREKPTAGPRVHICHPTTLEAEAGGS